jgi:hypothetical protein
MEKPKAESLRGRDVVLALVVLGSAWGFLEVVLGGAMKSASIPYKGDLLTGLGIGIMAIAIAWFRRPLLVVGVAAIAVALKQLAVPILHLPFMCKANSCLAVMLAGGALAGTAAAVGGRLHKGLGARIATGFSACLLGSVGFYFIGMRAAPCKYLLSFNRPGGFVAFLGAEGLIWAVLGGVFLPVGYRVGLALGPSLYGLRTDRPAIYYAASAAIIACTWIVSGFAIAAGL